MEESRGCVHYSRREGVLVQISYSRKVLYVMMLVNKLSGKTAFEDKY